ncbi:5'-nucleotidase, lipoprotein e(P4) family [Rosenbergiella australiborealis]|uniref:5'-nucleotidase, lipoprotein e(P4) family n=1 Tax=Rosenbergiella australiborealis TaxID=1544696 RepID=A0ABS5T180_9GAMM|nr:5'-nucleotidase, lipoprotein e(P4) family [Rosenbergiella australiborealis]MBT0726096.1 5'-nucleotidase, lipoprotein e(P4) family [Rosenbergiella australiborealis]
MTYIVKLMTGILLVSYLSACSTTEKKADQRLADQSVMAVNWMQQSGEYQAIALQTFRFATSAFQQSVDAGVRSPAVIVDLDETMIDNSAYQAWAAQQQAPFTDKTWSQWTHAEQALAIPGAVDFARYVDSHGGTLFYVSNRSVHDREATIANLRVLGFPGITDQTLLLSTSTSNKQARFDTIHAEGFQVVVYVGDNLNDFGAATWHKNNSERRAFVEKNRAKFGTEFFLLPNPSYGDWESGLSNGYSAMRPSEKLHTRLQALRVWKAPQ